MLGVPPFIRALEFDDTCAHTGFFLQHFFKLLLFIRNILVVHWKSSDLKCFECSISCAVQPVSSVKKDPASCVRLKIKILLAQLSQGIIIFLYVNMQTILFKCFGEIRFRMILALFLKETKNLAC